MYKSKNTKRLLSLVLSLIITFATQMPIFSIDVSDDFVAEPLVESENVSRSSDSLTLLILQGNWLLGNLTILMLVTIILHGRS